MKRLCRPAWKEVNFGGLLHYWLAEFEDWHFLGGGNEMRRSPFKGHRFPQAIILTAIGVPELGLLQALDRAEAFAEQRSKATDPNGRLQLRSLIEQITIAEDGVTISLAISDLLNMLGHKIEGMVNEQTHDLSVPACLQREGMEMRLVDERASAAGPDATMVRLLTKGLGHPQRHAQGRRPVPDRDCRWPQHR